MYHMGILLFWIHDRSPGCARTYHLLDRSLELILRLIALARLPPLRPLIRTVLGLLADLRQGPEEASESPRSSE
jgi:hypothetical protein